MTQATPIAATFGPVDQNNYVRALTRHYKKSGDRTRTAGVTKKVREYARTILPDLMISRRDPVVLATEDEDYQ